MISSYQKFANMSDENQKMKDSSGAAAMLRYRYLILVLLGASLLALICTFFMKETFLEEK